ncbi:MAG: helix-turn-helix transcriptional regulator, partial [Nanoarchaeota archaeon]|nr:helix-turn-helix transcriptional regulator [Nanoarchaeota archaeon]
MYPKKVNLFDLDMYIEGKLEITNLINQKLKEKNLNVRQLAKKINISNPTIYRFLNGKSMRG